MTTQVRTKKKTRTVNGKPVVYAKEPLELHVTDKNVRMGVKKDWTNCAIAQACMEQGYLKAAATKSRLVVEDNNKIVVYAMPTRARNQLVGFDRSRRSKQNFTPGDYIFPPLSPSHQANGKRKGSTTNQNLTRNQGKKSVKRNVLIGVRERFSIKKTFGVAV